MSIFFRIICLLIYFFCFHSNVMAQVVRNDLFSINLSANNMVYITGSEYCNITEKTKQSDNDGIIYELNISKDVKTLFHEKSYFWNLKLSPNDQLLSVMQNNSLSKRRGVLIIEKEKKNELLFIEEKNILEYSWSPDSKSIVYIIGEHSDEEGRGDKIDGVWIYNIEKQKRTKITDRTLNVEWFSDNLIYLIDTWTFHKGIMKNTRIFNYQTGKIEQQGLDGLKYSLDGRYYLRLSEESIGFWPYTEEDKKKILLDVCEFKTKKDIPRERLVNVFEFPEFIAWEKIMWAANNRIIVPRNTQGKMSISIYDIRNDMFLKREYGTLVGTNYKRDKLVMYTLDKKFIIVNVP